MYFKNIFYLIASLFLFSCTEDRTFQEEVADPNLQIIHYWDFNDEQNLLSPKVSIGNASINYTGASFDSTTEATTLNARQNSDAGNALRLRNPSSEVVFSMPTLGFKDVVLTYATMRTGSGAQIQKISYSVDGTNYTTNGLNETEFAVTETFVLRKIDFKGINTITNIATFKVKIIFSNGNENPTGNNRFDNFVLEGLPSGDPIPSILLHYWHFNNLPDGNLNNPVVADFSLLSTESPNITYPGTGAGYADLFSPGSDINTRMGELAGKGIRFRNPSDTRSVVVSMPSTGYKDLIIKFATFRTNTGAQTQNFSYSIDGVNFINTNLNVTTYSPQVEPNFELVTIDLSNIPAVNNNPNLKLRIQFAGSNTSLTTGNSRFDNLSIDAKTL